MPLCLSPGWNQIQFNLADFVRRAYATNYVETVRIQMHANVLLRRIFFSDRLYSDEEKPAEYRLFKTLPDPAKQKLAIKNTIPRRSKLPKEEPVARPVTPVTTDNEQEEEKELELIELEEEILLKKEPTENVSFHKGVDFPLKEVSSPMQFEMAQEEVDFDDSDSLKKLKIQEEFSQADEADQ